MAIPLAVIVMMFWVVGASLGSSGSVDLISSSADPTGSRLLFLQSFQLGFQGFDVGLNDRVYPAYVGTFDVGQGLTSYLFWQYRVILAQSLEQTTVYNYGSFGFALVDAQIYSYYCFGTVTPGYGLVMVPRPCGHKPGIESGYKIIE